MNKILVCCLTENPDDIDAMAENEENSGKDNLENLDEKAEDDQDLPTEGEEDQMKEEEKEKEEDSAMEEPEEQSAEKQEEDGETPDETEGFQPQVTYCCGGDILNVTLVTFSDYVTSICIIMWISVIMSHVFSTSRPRQNGRHLADDIFKCIFLNGNVWILIKISQKFAPMGPINNILALVQMMAWRQPGDKPLSEPMMARMPMHICVTQPQWVQWFENIYVYQYWHINGLVLDILDCICSAFVVLY